jgi:hypothetical protein
VVVKSRESLVSCNRVFLLTFLQNWKKELEKHREKLLSGNESSSKKRQVTPLSVYGHFYHWFIMMD